MTKTAVMKTVEFVYESSTMLTERDIWPDGDAPDNWGLQDVADRVKRDGGKVKILRDWNLADALRLDLYCGCYEDPLFDID